MMNQTFSTKQWCCRVIFVETQPTPLSKQSWVRGI